MTKPSQTLTVIGPHGSEVTVLKPGLGKVIVIAQAGATVRGTRFYHPTLINVSEHYARQPEQGRERLHRYHAQARSRCEG